MKSKNLFGTKLLIKLLCLALLLHSSVLEAKAFQVQVKNIDPHLQLQMGRLTWHPGCPVNLSQLHQINLTYWGLDQKVHTGTLIINQARVSEVIIIFRKLFKQHFQFAKIIPLVAYGGDELTAMADNDTFSFNCRPITGSKTGFSRHADGEAIDINPLFNPYHKGQTILPVQSSFYLNRDLSQVGLIQADAAIVKDFTQQGWQWGGYWQTLKDYQHFEKN